MRTTLVLALVLAIGCKKETHKVADPVAQTGSQAGSGSAGSGSAVAVAPAPAAFVPPKIDAKKGIAFADAQGGSIETTAADGKKISIKDGTLVAIAAANDVSMGSTDMATVDVVVAGKQVPLPAGQVLREESLSRSPDGSVAVFHFVDSCGDLCHTMLYVVASDGRRKKLGDGVVDIVAAWRKDGKELAVGSGTLWVVSLPDLGIRHLEHYTAPAYSPDSTLYVRDQDGSAFTLVGDKAKRVWKAKKKAPLEDGDYGADDPAPVSFDKGKPSFAE